MGRPTDYTPEIAARIIAQLSEGKSLRKVCKAEDMPSESAVRQWALDDREGFSAQYTRARELGYLAMADELLEIANTPQIGRKTKTTDEGKVETTEGDMIEHRRLQVDTRKWMLSKMLPKVFGDKLALTDPDGGPLKVEVVTFTDGQ